MMNNFFRLLLTLCIISCSTEKDRKANASDPSFEEKVTADTVYIDSFQDYTFYLPKIDLPYEISCRPTLDYGVEKSRDKILVVSDSIKTLTRGFYALIATMESSYVILRLEPADVALPFLIKVDLNGEIINSQQLLKLRNCAFDDDDSLDFNSQFIIRENLTVSRSDFTYLQDNNELLDSVTYDYDFR